MSPGMTVVPRQSTTTSAPPAPVLDPAPSAAIRPCATGIAAASSGGDARMPVASAPMFTRPRLAISPRRGERPPHSSTEGGYAPLGLPRPTPPTDHPRRPSPKSRLRRHSRRSTRGTGKRPPRLPDTPHLSASTLLHSRLQYSPRQRSTRALAACPSYERNIRRRSEEHTSELQS